MSDDQFTRLFNHMNKRFDELHGEIVRVEERVDRLYGVVDAISGEIRDCLVENAARDAQLRHHESAIDQLAARSKLCLHYE